MREKIYDPKKAWQNPMKACHMRNNEYKKSVRKNIAHIKRERRRRVSLGEKSSPTHIL